MDTFSEKGVGKYGYARGQGNFKIADNRIDFNRLLITSPSTWPATMKGRSLASLAIGLFYRTLTVG